MADIVKLPKLGLSEYGELVAWEVDIGNHVEADQILAVIESDKASAEVQAPTDGILLATYIEEGEEIEIEPGRPIAVLGEEGESAPSLEEVEGGADPEASDSADTASEASTDSTPSSSTESGGDVKATPRAKRFASEHDVELGGVEGTGPQGAVTEDDVRAALEREDSGPDGEASTPGELTVTDARELTGTRKVIADRLSQSAREKPHVMGTRDISIERLQDVKQHLAAQHDVEVSLNDLILHFVGRVLEDLPEFNALYEDDEHKLIEEVNVGYAVDSPKGLVVPVISNVADRSLSELSEERRRLVKAVLNDEQTSADLQGGTFTVTNVGVFDMDVSYSIINPPQVAILAIGRRKPTPVERDGEIQFEESVTFSLTIDHRVLDGADSGAFLEQLAEYLEYPGRILDSI